MKDIRIKRLIITLSLLLGYQFIKFIPVAGLNPNFYFWMLNGTKSLRFSIFSLGLWPYIEANVIVLLLTCVLPALKNLKDKEGLGSDKFNQMIFSLTGFLAIIQSLFIALRLDKEALFGDIMAMSISKPIFVLVTVLSLTAAVFLTLWLGKLITRYGIGHGITLLFLFPIFGKLIMSFVNVGLHHTSLIFFVILVVVLLMSGIIVYFLREKTKIELRRGEGAPNAVSLTVPTRMVGLLPIYFASQVMLLPATLPSLGFGRGLLAQILSGFRNLNFGISWIIYGILIVFFSFFMSAILLEPQRLAQKVKSMGFVVQGAETDTQATKLLQAALAKMIFKWSLFLLAMDAVLVYTTYWLWAVHWQSSAYGLILILGFGLALGRYFGGVRKKFHHRIATTNDVSQIFAMKALLKAHGIESVIENVEALGDLFALPVGDLGQRQLLVDESSLSRAREILGQT